MKKDDLKAIQSSFFAEVPSEIHTFLDDIPVGDLFAVQCDPDAAGPRLLGVDFDNIHKSPVDPAFDMLGTCRHHYLLSFQIYQGMHFFAIIFNEQAGEKLIVGTE